PVEQEMKDAIEHTDYNDMPTEGEIVENRWNKKKYIVADSPITINGEHQGHVFMFAPTNNVKKIVDHLSDQFLVIGMITILLTIITIFILSRFITLPLIKIDRKSKRLNSSH